jgi:hypothetical protein
MTYSCGAFYSMQKIIQNGNAHAFHRKFGQQTSEKHGVYIWGFAQNLSNDSKMQLDSNPLNEFAVTVKSQDIGIYYIGKATSINIFERIMQERANLFGGFFPIFEWDHYFTATPFLSIWNQLDDTIARLSSNQAHFNRLNKYQNCVCSNLNPFRLPCPIHYSNAYFNKNNLIDRIMQPKCNTLLKTSIEEMSKKFIFTWIEIDDSQDTERVEKLLHEMLGVNILGIGGTKRIGAINKGNFSNYDISNSDVSISFKSNPDLYKRIEQINGDSITLQNKCKCFKD